MKNTSKYNFCCSLCSFLFICFILFSASATAQQLVYCEYFFDDDPGAGNAVQLSISNASTFEGNFTINTSELGVGYHTLYVRFKNSDDMWCNVKKRTFYVQEPDENNTNPSDIVAAEYYYDNETTGSGNEQALSGIVPGVSVDYTVNIAAPEDVGYHTLYVRMKNALGLWGPVHSRTFYIRQQFSGDQPGNSIVAAEYYYNNEENGIGQEQISPGFTSGNPVEHNTQLASPVDFGYHTLYYRVKADNDLWSPVKSRTFYVKAPEGTSSQIVAVEYYTDDDPGLELRTRYTDFSPSESINISFDALSNTTEPGMHTLHALVYNAEGAWSQVKSDEFQVVDCDLPEQAIQPEGQVAICYDYPDTEYTTIEVSDADSYEWALIPEEAGTLNISAVSVQINWAIDFEGDAELKVRALNACGTGKWSGILNISISPDNECLPEVYWARNEQGSWHDPQNWAAKEDGAPVNTVPSEDKKVIIKGKLVNVTQSAESSDIQILSKTGATTGLHIDQGQLTVHGKVKIEKLESESSATNLQVINGGSIECVE